MAQSPPKAVDEYIAAQPATAQRKLRRVRAAIRKALPAPEIISYKIPAYRNAGRLVVYFAAWTSHYSIYPASQALIAALKYGGEEVEIKARTLRFPLTSPVPQKPIERIAKELAAERATHKKCCQEKAAQERDRQGRRFWSSVSLASCAARAGR